MLSITKVNNSIKVEGLDNKQFPDNGTLMIPLNSVILTLDESNIATFRSAANNDVLFSGVITDIQISGTPMTKQTITTAFTNVANSSGGGGGTVDAYTKAETDALLATKANESELSDYATIESLAVVATSGDYADLTNKPVIPAAQIQSDWNQSDNSAVDYIKNKPVNVSAFTNDAGYLTQHQSLADYSTTQEMNTAIATATNDMATMTWVGEQGYLTQHQDISGLATKSELAEVEAEIPSLEGYATEQWVENQNYLTEHQSLDNYYTKTQTDTAISTATNDMATETWVQQQGYLTQHQDISGLATKQELATHTENGDIHVTAAQKTAWSAKADLNDIPDVTGYIDGAVYDSQTKRINFKHGETVVAYIDATPFVVDGMVDTVEITGGNLVVTWNTDAGKQSTSIPLTDIFNPSNYYDKTDTDALLATKANSADLAVVASSGSYDDLTNKPAIPTVPTNVSAFTNDAGYTTNEGTITGITMNGASKGTSGNVDLGTVITEHQSLAGYAQTADLAVVATSGSYTDLTDKPNLFSGDYNDLTNKPTIPTVPTNVSAFTNDAGYTTNTGTITGITMNGTSKGTSGVVDLGTVITDISGKQDVIDASHKLDADLVDDTTSTNKFVTASDKSTWSGKQDALVSGTNIKTINNESILGSGNITIEGGGGISGITMNGSPVTVTSGVADLGTVVTDVSGKQDAIRFSSPLNYNENNKILSLGISINKGNSGEGNLKMNGKMNYLNNVTGNYSVALGTNNTVSGNYSAAIGGFDSYGAGSTVSGSSSIALGRSHNIAKHIATATGQGHTISNDYETAVGRYSQSNHSTDTFGDSGNTLFAVGNGTSASARSNAFEVRQNGDIYISNSDHTQTIKLQDNLGGGGGGITGITMNGSAVTVTSGVANLGTVVTDISGKQDTLVSGTNIKTINNESILGSGNITIQGGGGTQVQADWNQSDTTAVDYIKNKPTIPTVPTTVSSFTNDAGYITSAALSSYYTKTEIDAMIGNISSSLDTINGEVI